MLWLIARTSTAKFVSQMTLMCAKLAGEGLDLSIHACSKEHALLLKSLLKTSERAATKHHPTVSHAMFAILDTP